MHTKARLTVIIAAIAAMPLLGCVPQDRYDALLTANRSLEEQLVSMESERDTARSHLETVRQQLTRTQVNLKELEAQNSRLEGDLARIVGDYDEMMRRVSSLEIGPLPEDVESALHELALAYPDVLSFDARRGLLRFASDFTFDLGSVSLKSEAEKTLDALARILAGSQAAGFEVRVIGHTDNVPIGRPETRRSHPTNVHLSVHRAISVRDALVNSGISPARVQVAGYGEHRPRVANRPGGTAENRRVEIFLSPMPPDVSPAAVTAGSEPDAERGPSRPATAGARTDDPMK